MRLFVIAVVVVGGGVAAVWLRLRGWGEENFIQTQTLWHEPIDYFSVCRVSRRLFGFVVKRGEEEKRFACCLSVGVGCER